MERETYAGLEVIAYMEDCDTPMGIIQSFSWHWATPDAVKLLRGSDAAFERIGYAADSIARESIRAFLARNQKEMKDE